jgi:L-alanine-DL-glutamate epimerase-like enolase superfamily enzyme
MTDANQGFTLSEAMRRARHLETLDVAWFEEPLPADDLAAHAELSRHTSVPIAVGESLYSPSQFKDYLLAGACSIVQVDVARIGGITPWLKVAHMAEAFNAPVCQHFLMELHLALCCAVPNSRCRIHPQLDAITRRSPDPTARVAPDRARHRLGLVIARLPAARLLSRSLTRRARAARGRRRPAPGFHPAPSLYASIGMMMRTSSPTALGRP